MRARPLLTLLLPLLPLALSAPSSGCNKEPPFTPGHHHSQTIDSAGGGGTRKFILGLPTSYNASAPVPLILSFHGAGKNMTNQLYLSNVINEAWNPVAISVYPDSAAGYWEGTPSPSTPDDLAFVEDLLTHLEDTLCVDTSRVYCTGKSLGGGFCNVLACDAGLSRHFAAIAPVSGAYYTTPKNESFAADCKPARGGMPVLEFHGLADTTIKYDGGEHKGVDLRSVPDWVEQWALLNGCAEGDQPTETKTFGGNVTQYEYTCGGKEAIVGHYAIKGLKHVWPSTGWNPDNGGHGTYIDATPLIVDFFNKYSLPEEGKREINPGYEGQQL